MVENEILLKLLEENPRFHKHKKEETEEEIHDKVIDELKEYHVYMQNIINLYKRK